MKDDTEKVSGDTSSEKKENVPEDKPVRDMKEPPEKTSEKPEETPAKADDKPQKDAAAKTPEKSSGEAMQEGTLKRIAKIRASRNYVKTGIKGFDDLFDTGIPKGTSILIAGGAGSGKTIFCLQLLANAASKGSKCLFMSFEENEERLREHMEDFGWNPHELEKKGKLKITKMNTFDISRSLDALMAKNEGELLIDVKPVILPKDFMPDIMVIDSISAIASAFKGKEGYRIYIENFFRYLENLGITTFLISEINNDVINRYSPTGVEEFLADGVIVLYNVRKGDIRESAIEILKMRGTKHLKKIVAMQITSGSGIEVYPEQEVYTKIV